jgi:flagellar biosynthesis/type III secretory pathway protein FliH
MSNIDNEINNFINKQKEIKDPRDIKKEFEKILRDSYLFLDEIDETGIETVLEKLASATESLMAKAKNEGLEEAAEECENMAKTTEKMKFTVEELKIKAVDSYHTYMYTASRIRSLKEKL